MSLHRCPRVRPLGGGAGVLSFSSGLLFLAGACGLRDEGPREGASREKPNVVYVLSDTHRWGALSFTQTPGVQTPNLDALARQGVSFDRMYVNLPACTPYRAILMTGRWPYQQGLIANHMKLGERVDLPEGQQTKGTLSWAFRNAGYTTAHIGKWHLSTNLAALLQGKEGEDLADHDAGPFGFDKSIVWSGTNDHRKSCYSVDGGELVEWEGPSNATATTDQALSWIEEVHKGKKPFFIIISINPPHGPFHDALDEKKALYPNESVLPFHPLDQARDWETHRDYHALVSGVDDEVGKISARLDELGLSRNTLLIYTSDHGAMGGLNGIPNYGQKRNPNDESVRVPFLIRWPGKIPANVVLGTLSSTIDMFPTLAGLAGLRGHLQAASTAEAEVSLAYLESLPGADLSRNVLGEPGGPEPTSVFLMHPSNMNNRFSSPQPVWRAVVTEKYTYAVTEEGEYALWDNSDDYQRTNLVHRPETYELRLKLWNELNGWMQRAEAPFIDNWFKRAPPNEIESWNREHGFGDDNEDRDIGKNGVFDMSKSKPVLP